MENYIFVLEDNKEIRELIEYLLVSKGYQVKSFKNAGEFYNAIEESPHPGLFILDVMLPDGNGMKICENLKADQSMRTIPVMLMSANATKESAARAGAEDFISKPFDISNFIKRVTRQIARASHSIN